jgi:hypothetical protein
LEDVQPEAQKDEERDLGRVWNVGMVEVSKNPFAVLGDSAESSEGSMPELEDSSSESEGEQVPPPPVPLGNGLGKATSDLASSTS